MTNRAILTDLIAGTFLMSIGIWGLMLVLSVPFIAIPGAAVFGTGLSHFIRGWRAAWSDEDA